jgi:hypothetical protein
MQAKAPSARFLREKLDALPAPARPFAKAHRIGAASESLCLRSSR